jgi:hypothetical protein
MDLVSIGILAGIAAVTLWVHLLRRSDQSRAFRAAAKGRGLARIAQSGGLFERPEASAAAGDLRVRFWSSTDRVGEVYTHISVAGPAPLLPGLALRSEGVDTEEAKRRGAREIEIGDPRFDVTFYIGGTPARVLAALDHDTRRRLLRLQTRLEPRGRLVVVNGELQAEVRHEASEKLEPVVRDVLGLLLETARELPTGVDPARGLGRNVREDPEDAVRASNLMTLLREYPNDEVTRQVLDEARRDPSAELRLRAGIALGAEGASVLWQLVDDPATGDSCAARALSALRPLGLEKAKALLDHALRARRVETGRVCLGAIAREGAGGVEILAKVLNVEDGPLAVAAAAALGASGTSAAETPLLAALRRGNVELRTAAAEALALVGGIEAIAALKEAADRFSDPRFRSAARQAVAKIQARAGGVAPGQLSVAATETGQVSIAEGESGRISFAGSEAGRVSLKSGE